jgi:hypothetical protein
MVPRETTMSAREKVSSRDVPLIVLANEPEAISLPSSVLKHRVFTALSPNEVSVVVGALVFLNIVIAFLLTSRPIPSWLELNRFASDLDAALLIGAAHIGLASCVILLAARKLFLKHGLTRQLYFLAGIAFFGTILCLGRYWAYPVRQEVLSPFATAQDGVPLQGTLPGGR